MAKPVLERMTPRRGALLAGVVFWALVGAMAGLAPSAAQLPQWPPGGNIRVLDAKSLPPEAAEKIYRRLLDSMVGGYLRSGRDDIDYRRWERLTPFPHRSDLHGQRFVNVYLDDTAKDAWAPSAAAPLPAGARVAMDSFSVIQSGAASRGPLFLMEKMPAGFWPEAGDWRYTMIMPNGQLFGTSKGEGSVVVEFCAECHEQAADRDRLFTRPEAAGTD